MDDATGSVDRARTEAAQVRAMADLWEHGDHVETYASRELRPAEVMVLVRYREELAGRVLELGSGAGRVAGYLIALGGEVHGLDVSSRMVEYTSRSYPEGSFEQGDLRDLSRYQAASFDVVFASFNILDAFNDGERRRVLAEIRGLLRGGGLLIMSSNNLDHSPTGDLGKVRQRSLVWLLANAGRMPRRIRNRRRLSRFELRTRDYAILNDTGHDYATLHYYISRDAQERQLAEQGLTLLECLDLDGRPVAPGETAPESPELHYIARRSGG